MTRILCSLVFLLSLVACNPSKVDVANQAAFSEAGHIQAIIEIPAGTNHKIEYDNEQKDFVHNTVDGKSKIVDFLPYPGNYGFIPATLMDKKRGGDGEPLDILVIGESVKTGSLVPILPIGALMLKDQEEIDTKIIAVPADPKLQVIKANNYESFFIEYNAAHHIIQEWFMNHKGLGKVELLGWKDEKYAFSEIKKWAKK